LSGARVDQYVPDQVCVDDVRQRQRIEMPDAVGEPLHARQPNRAFARMRRSLVAREETWPTA